jgi:hypothetical protein
MQLWRRADFLKLGRQRRDLSGQPKPSLPLALGRDDLARLDDPPPQ